MITYLDLFFNTISRFWAALEHGSALPFGNWNYLFLFVFVIIQGPMTKLLSGAVVSSTHLKLGAVILVAICASLSADIAWYYLGRMGKLQRYFRRKATRRRKVVDVLQAAMEKHYFKVLLLGKLSLGMAIPSIIAAGVSKISWRKWFPTIVLGEILYTCTLVLFGYFATESISHANQTIKIIGIAATTIIVLILVIYLPHTIRKILMEEGTTLDHPVDS